MYQQELAEKASKLSNALGVSLDYLVGNMDVEPYKSLMGNIVFIQQLACEDKICIMYSIDGLIQYAQTKLAYATK